jgi:hypothetical protein
MEDIPNLDFLSPNERERYIKEQREETRKQRIKEARRAYSSFTKERQQQYAEAKKNRDLRQAQNAAQERNSQTQSEIEDVRTRLELIRAGIGTAHECAVSEALKAPTEEERARKQAELEREIARRYARAMDEVRANDPRLPLRERARQLSDARRAAMKCKTRAMARYSKELGQRTEAERQEQEHRQKEECKLLHPAIMIDYAKTFFHTDLGYLPINEGLYAHETEMKESRVRYAELEKKRKAETRERTANAARAVQTNHEVESLAHELDAIRELEFADEMDKLKQKPQISHPSVQTYLVDDRERARQARMERFMTLAEDAPKPRAHAPQPQRPHELFPSPVASREPAIEEEEEEESDD